MATPFPFTSGQTLTAAQMNAITTLPSTTKTASHTLVIADQGTRVIMNSGTATTITVNTSIFGAGDIVEIQNIGTAVCTVTAGSCTVSSAGPLAIPQHGGGQLVFSSASAATYFPTAVTATASGLTLVKTQTIGTAVSSVQVTGAFSATYDNYKISISGGVGSATSTLATILGSSTTGYSGSMIYYTATGSSASPGTPSALSSATSSFSWSGSANTNSIIYNVDIQNPFLAKYSFLQGYWYDIAQSGFTFGAHSSAVSYSDFTITPSTGTLTGGTIRVYGYQNS